MSMALFFNRLNHLAVQASHTIARLRASFPDFEARAIFLFTPIFRAIARQIGASSDIQELLSFPQSFLIFTVVQAVHTPTNFWVAVSTIQKADAVSLGAIILWARAFQHNFRINDLEFELIFILNDIDLLRIVLCFLLSLDIEQNLRLLLNSQD